MTFSYIFMYHVRVSSLFCHTVYWSCTLAHILLNWIKMSTLEKRYSTTNLARMLGSGQPSSSLMTHSPSPRDSIPHNFGEPAVLYSLTVQGEKSGENASPRAVEPKDRSLVGHISAHVVHWKTTESSQKVCTLLFNLLEQTRSVDRRAIVTLVGTLACWTCFPLLSVVFVERTLVSGAWKTKSPIHTSSRAS